MSTRPAHIKKYPRTPHLPWSPGNTSDDIFAVGLQSQFAGEEIVVTEKMDGENTTMYRDDIHARSLDSRHHPSRAWVKNLHHSIAHLIPEQWRICGENLYARHALGYDDLPSYFMTFLIFDEHDTALSIDETLEWCQLLGLEHVPILYRGPWDERIVRAIEVDTTRSEGYVVRRAGAFAFEHFGQSVAKWVRPDHVNASDTHWMHAEVRPNGLTDPDD